MSCRWLLGCVTAAIGCGSGTGDLWGLLHGDVTVQADGSVQGVLVWEFFEADWEAARSGEEHRCGRVLTVEGPADPSCADCAVAVTLLAENTEHDCPGVEGVSPQLQSMDRLWIRKAQRAPAGQWPDASWGWSVGWSGGAPTDEGVAWDEGMEFGEPPVDPSSLLGRRVRLSPTRAHAFSGKELADGAGR
jgi:hypothetical protein